MGCLQARNRSGGIAESCGLFDDGVLTLLYLEQLPRYFHVRTTVLLVRLGVEASALAQESS
jgi:hypothetical protein